MTSHPPIKLTVYGQPGAGKSTFAATFPKPLLVLCIDPRGKEIPYRDLGETTEETTDYALVNSKKSGNLLARLEFYEDDFDDLQASSSRTKLFKRFETLHREVQQWGTIIVDSASSIELNSRMYDQYVLNKGNSRRDAPYITSTSDLEDLICWRFARFRTNVLCLCHEAEVKEKIGTGKNAEWIVVGYRPALPGQVGNFKLNSQFGEYYRMYVGRNNEYLLQTSRTAKHQQIRSGIHAPDPCYPHYEALWGEQTAKGGDPQ